MHIKAFSIFPRVYILSDPAGRCKLSAPAPTVGMKTFFKFHHNSLHGKDCFRLTKHFFSPCFSLYRSLNLKRVILRLVILSRCFERNHWLLKGLSFAMLFFVSLTYLPKLVLTSKQGHVDNSFTQKYLFVFASTINIANLNDQKSIG